MTAVMKAVRLHEFGGPEVLRYDDVPVPEPTAGEVLVRVHAVGVNPPDWYVREGMPDVPPEVMPPPGLPLIPGTDVSGVVTAVAADVEGFAVGDEVVGMLRFPGTAGSAYGEYVARAGYLTLLAGRGRTTASTSPPPPATSPTSRPTSTTCTPPRCPWPGSPPGSS